MNRTEWKELYQELRALKTVEGMTLIHCVKGNYEWARRRIARIIEILGCDPMQCGWDKLEYHRRDESENRMRFHTRPKLRGI